MYKSLIDKHFWLAKVLQVLICLPVVLLATGCVSYIERDQLATARKGMIVEQVVESVGEKAYRQFDFEYDQARYEGLLYRLKVGSTTQTNFYTDSNGIQHMTTTEVPVLNDYYFLFDDVGELSFWGLFQDFTKSSKANIHQLADTMRNEAYK